MVTTEHTNLLDVSVLSDTPLDGGFTHKKRGKRRIMEKCPKCQCECVKKHKEFRKCRKCQIVWMYEPEEIKKARNLKDNIRNSSYNS